MFSCDSREGERQVLKKSCMWLREIVNENEMKNGQLKIKKIKLLKKRQLSKKKKKYTRDIHT